MKTTTKKQMSTKTLVLGAILAAVGCGEYESVQAACEKLVHVVDTVEPDPVLVEKYEARYQEFRKLYPAVKEFF